jgi:hypothetical protein
MSQIRALPWIGQVVAARNKRRAKPPITKLRRRSVPLTEDN